MNRRKHTIPILGLGLILLDCLPGNILARDHDLEAQQPREEHYQRTDVQVTKLAPAPGPIYQPPRRGAPRVRIAGGTRGEWDTLPTAYVLVPEHTGLTTKKQPSLFWYVSGPTTARFEITLIDSDDQSIIDPILEVSLEPPDKGGLRRFNLSQHGIELLHGIKYQWSVALIPDLERRSRDLITSGRIERVKPSQGLRSRLAGTRPEELPSVFAREGYWYDALTALSDLLEASPTDPQLRGHRAALLEQVGLSEVAAFDRKPTLRFNGDTLGQVTQ